MKETYRLFVNGNPEATKEKNMRIILPTAPMFLNDKYELDRCWYRLNRYILQEDDTDLDNNTLVVELNIPSATAITIPLTQGGDGATIEATGSGLVTFLTEITGDNQSCKYYNRIVENACLGNAMWGNAVEIKLYRVALDTGIKTRWTADQDILFEFEIEPYCKC